MVHFLKAIYGGRNVFHSRLELERKKLRIVARLVEVAAMEPKGLVSASTVFRCSPSYGPGSLVVAEPNPRTLPTLSATSARPH
jgi:hypothetical protein